MSDDQNTCELPHPRLKAGKISAKEMTILQEIIEAIHEHGSPDVRGVVASLDNKSSVEAQMKKISKDASDEAPNGLAAVAWSLTDAEKHLDLHEEDEDQELFKSAITLLKNEKIVRQLGRGRGQALVLLTDGFVHLESPQHGAYNYCAGIEVQEVEQTDEEEVVEEPVASDETEVEETEVEESEQEFYPDGQPVPPPHTDDDLPPETVQVEKNSIREMRDQLQELIELSSKQTEEYQALQALVREAIRQNAAEVEEDEPEEEIVNDEDFEGDDPILPSIHSF